MQKTYTTEYNAVIKAAVSGERREPLLIFIINMSHDGEHIDADMKKGKLQLRRTSTIMNRFSIDIAHRVSMIHKTSSVVEKWSCNMLQPH